MRNLDNLLKRFAQGELGLAVAKENFENSQEILFRRMAAIEGLFETRRWDTEKYAKYRGELLAYFWESVKLTNYKCKYSRFTEGSKSA
jgi:hypothetical protein